MSTIQDLGKFITIEGIDGAGKTAVFDAVIRTIEAHGRRVVRTREPGGTRLGEALRSLFLSKDMNIAPQAEILMVFASRIQHLHEVILPEINAGAWVLCDRFTDATYAYQGGGRGVGFEKVGIIEQWAQGDMRPDLTIFVDTSTETAAARSIGRADSELDRIETETEKFYMRVRQAYHALMDAEPERIKRIDGEQTKAQVIEKACCLIENYLNFMNGKSNS